MSKKPSGRAPKIQDPKRLNIDFYRGFEAGFHMNKAHALFTVLREKVLLQDRLFDGETDEKELSKFDENLRAEIYFTEFQSTEALFALLLAGIQPKPHWLFLLEYDLGTVRRAIEAYLARDAKALTKALVSSMNEFLELAVYSGLRPSDAEKAARWGENLDSLDWLIRRVGRRYLDAEEYNAYKHGLRVRTGATRLTMFPDGRPDQADVIAESPDSLTFLRVRPDSTGQRRAFVRTKHFSHVESYNHVFGMWKLFSTIRHSRLAHFESQPGAPIELFLEMDRETIARSSRVAQFEFSV